MVLQHMSWTYRVLNASRQRAQAPACGERLNSSCLVPRFGGRAFSGRASPCPLVNYDLARAGSGSIGVLSCRGSFLLGGVSANFMSEPVEGPEIEEDAANGKKGKP